MLESNHFQLEDNISQDSNLDTDAFVRALLIKRNTPDPICKLSPAEIVFGRKLRDTLPRIDKTSTIFFDNQINPIWRDAWKEESSLRTRYQGSLSRLGEHSKTLSDLIVGDRVAVQNQSGSKPTKWDRTGVVLEIHDYDKYIVKVDGSGRLSQRNRRYLKKLCPDTGMFDSSPVVLRKPIENGCLPAGIVCKGQDVTLQPADHHRNLQSTDVHPTQIQQQVQSYSQIL